MNSDTATVRSAPEASTSPSRAPWASMWSGASVSTSSPVAARSSSTTPAANPSGALSPVPTAVPPIGSWARRGSTSRSRAAPYSAWVAHPPASWPSVIGTASMRWVRPALTTCAQSSARRRSVAARCSSAGITSVTSDSVAATWIVVGNTSLLLCEALTWSFGCTSIPEARVARVAITSLAFMLELVPDPVWNTSIGNWASCAPAATSSAAAAIAAARSLAPARRCGRSPAPRRP